MADFKRYCYPVVSLFFSPQLIKPQDVGISNASNATCLVKELRRVNQNLGVARTRIHIWSQLLLAGGKAGQGPD